MGAERPAPPVRGRGTPAPVRLLRAWRAMPREHRLAVIGAVGLLVSLFLPWYEETRFFASTQVKTVLHATVTHSAISHFTFVEAAELLTVGGVLGLLFARAEGRAFHLPGGDGTIVTAAGAWALLLVVWRFFDKPDFGPSASAGLHWGVLGPLIAGSAIVYAGLLMRAAHRPEPALPGERPARSRTARRARPARAPDAVEIDDAQQPAQRPRTAVAPSKAPAPAEGPPPLPPPAVEPPTEDASDAEAPTRRSALPFDEVPDLEDPPDAPDQLTIPLAEPPYDGGDA